MYNNNLTKDPFMLLEKIITLRKEVYKEGFELLCSWKPLIKRRFFLNSAANLAFYLALRRRDIREIQDALIPFGLSSLGRIESRTLSNLDAVLLSLSRITGKNTDTLNYPSCDSFLLGRRMLERNTKRIFGQHPQKKNSRIMVTLPPETAENYKYVCDLISSGMNVARINCAHDNEEIWTKMIENIQKAKIELHIDCKVLMDIAGPKSRINQLLTTLQNPKVFPGHKFLLTGHNILQISDEFDIIAGCSIPEIINQLRPGDPVLVDDGMIEGEVESISERGAVIKVKKVLLQKGVRLKAHKGLNFPKTSLKIKIITDKDKRDLDFICRNADIIGCSFVKNAEDINELQAEIQKRTGEENFCRIPLVAKIETVQGIKNLSKIIVEAAGKTPFSIMIARGDLAIETGYLRLAELQEEIMWICEAAHIPVIWATQVLETMVQTGIPTRAEITDAVMGSEAECIMLNKGNYLP
ncbi:MAG: pyruvate kinase, partial [Clostridiaceae bacterium]